MKFFKKRFLFWIIIILALTSSYLALPPTPINLNLGGVQINTLLTPPEINWKLGNFNFKRDMRLKLGLDLQGGTHVVLSTDMKDIPADRQSSALESAKEVIERRINFFGVSEPLIQTSKVGDEYRIIVELAGVTDVNQAKDLIGQTAKLDFRELKDENIYSLPTLENTNPTGLTGSDLKSASVQYSGEGSQPVVAFETTSAGATKMAEVTRKLIGKPLAIFLDDTSISNPPPTVQQEISGGSGVISGNFNVERAKSLANQLNAGALPVPVSVIEERTVGATLGAESVNRSIAAGIIGLICVSLFMILFYGIFGWIAVGALFIYTALNLALFKLVPITLTLSGIAGFILSVGMAVDANILTFERIREETRNGQRLPVALEVGFKRAWNSIRDSNISSLITCAILYWFGTGLVKGFAFTLALGIMTSMFTAIVITRTFLRVSRGQGV